MNLNPKLIQWYHTKPNTKREWLLWILNFTSIGYFSWMVVGILTEINFNGTNNPLLWTLTTYTYRNVPIVGLFYSGVQIAFQGNHFFTLTMISIAFFFLLFTMDLEPLWIGVLILWAMSIHEWFWFISDAIYYQLNNLSFNIDWVRGAYTSWVQLFIIVFIFPLRFKVLQKKVLVFIFIMLAMYFFWQLAGFPVSYDYAYKLHLTDINVHLIEQLIWFTTIMTLILVQPFEFHIRKPKEKRRLFK